MIKSTPFAVRRSLAAVALAACATLGLALPAYAAHYVVDTSPANNAYFDYPYLHVGQWVASAFNISASTTIRSIEGYLQAREVNTTLTAQVYTDGLSDHLPNAPAGGIAFNVADTAAGFYGAHGLSITLTPGRYWLAFEVRPGQTFNGYAFALPANDHPDAAYYQPCCTAGGYRLDTRLGGYGLRLGDDPTGAVPEPASWALLIVGMCLAGANLRRRKSRYRNASCDLRGTYS